MIEWDKLASHVKVGILEDGTQIAITDKYDGDVRVGDIVSFSEWDKSQLPAKHMLIEREGRLVKIKENPNG